MVKFSNEHGNGQRHGHGQCPYPCVPDLLCPLAIHMSDTDMEVDLDMDTKIDIGMDMDMDNLIENYTKK